MANMEAQGSAQTLTSQKKKQKQNTRKRKRTFESQPRHNAFDWESQAAWKDVTPADPFSLLVGSDEGGFMCLEEFEGDVYPQAGCNTADTEERQEKRPKKKKKRSGSGAGRIAEEPMQAMVEEEPIKAIASTESENRVGDMSAWVDLRLHAKLEKAIATLGFTQPTPIQRACIPAAAHEGKDVIGAAETGSGKTLAYVIPILQRLLEEEKDLNIIRDGECDGDGNGLKNFKKGSPLRALIVTPTRELALQVCDHFRAAAKYSSIKVVSIVGGMATQKQQRLLKQRPQAVVGTPGRLWELMSAGESHLLELQSLSFFVLDEADRMVEKGHFQELQSIIDILPKYSKVQKKLPFLHRAHGNSKEHSISSMKPNGCLEDRSEDVQGESLGYDKCQGRQTLVFSATLTLPPGFRKKLKRGFREAKLKDQNWSVAALSERAGVSYDAAVVNLTSENIVANQLEESMIECREEDKDAFLYYILKVHASGRKIVFCTSIAALRRVFAILQLLQVSAWPLHAQMQQRQRLKAMDRFRANDDCVLIATDVAARGLDILGVRSVIHYQLPHSAEVYVHRSGRTARASNDGCSILLVSPSDRVKYSALCSALLKKSGFPEFPINASYMPAIRKRVYMACEIDQLLRKNTQLKSKKSWLARNAEALEIDVEDLDENEESHFAETYGSGKAKSSQLKRLQQDLKHLVEQPLEPTSFSHRFITGAGISPLVAQQLKEYATKKSPASNGKGPNRTPSRFSSGGKDKLVVIGQEAVEPLIALRTLSNL